jgi:hypothetical protein
MKKILVIHIPLELNDLEDADFDIFLKESKEAAGIHVCVARSISEEESYIGRQFEINADYFETSIMEVPEDPELLAVVHHGRGTSDSEAKS